MIEETKWEKLKPKMHFITVKREVEQNKWLKKGLRENEEQDWNDYGAPWPLDFGEDIPPATGVPATSLPLSRSRWQ